ncbi:uncharacterized protein LOC133297243 [Gastrolobium bilobum]|uniref:uncharacterized protein LOC133297243 n=1 Tax=Gastrolobium bilobum TaxID=150636 RepID=UPI002AAF8A99|nr:uncharacterized protein LOC133297243 [Gastrolobium bilobum]
MPPKGKRSRNDVSSSSSSMPIEPPQTFVSSSIPTELPHLPVRPSHVRRESKKKWTVQAIVPFDTQMQPYGEAATLLSKVCGRIATDCNNVLVNYEGWDKVLDSYKTECYKSLKAPETIAKCYCLLTLGRRFRNGKAKLCQSVEKLKLLRDQLIAKVPAGVPKDQWSSFVDYHLKPSYKDQIYEELNQSTNPTEISTNDVVAKVFGPKNSGRVRGLGLGGLPSIAFGPTSGRFNPIGSTFSGANSAKSSQLKDDVTSLKTKLAASEESLKTLQTVMLAYIQMKEGQIPPELDALFGTTSAPVDEGSEEAIPTRGRSSLDSNRP